jgi:aminopeptidase N/puromycin-sensitive aminopeptidase
VDQPGAPLVTVKTKCAGNSDTLSFDQERYFYDQTKLEQGTSQLWQIPVCIKSGSSASQAKCELVTEKRQNLTLPGCADWAFINADAKGFYRSGYDSQAIGSMSQQLETAFMPAERIILLSDVLASVRVNREPIGDYLNLADGLKSDRNDAVLRQLLPQLSYIGERLTNDSDRDSYSLWVRQLLVPIAEQVGWEPKPGERDSVNSLRASLFLTLADLGHDPQTVALAHKLADQALAEPNSLNHEVAAAALSAAAANGDEALYDRIIADLKAAKTPEIYFRDLFILGRFRDPKLIDRTLQFALSPDMRSQDSPYLISSVLQRPTAEKQGWSFVQDHWAGIEKLGGPYAAAAIVQATGSFCDPGMREEVQSFFTAHPAPGAERSLKQSIERANYCIEMRTQQQQPLGAWLKQKEGSGTAPGLGSGR